MTNINEPFRIHHEKNVVCKSYIEAQSMIASDIFSCRQSGCSRVVMTRVHSSKF